MRSPFDYIDASGDCWEWAGSRDTAGYGRFWNGEKLVSAHRTVWEALVGPIAGTLDHLCRNRACVNPDHLEDVPLGVNVLRGYGPTSVNRRKTHCKNGHPFDDVNTYFEGRWRRCRTCRHDAVKRHHALHGRRPA